MNAVIDLQAVDFSYGGVPVLSAIDLQVADGEFLGIVGPNAGGKSTLLKLILGLLQPQSRAGSACFGPAARDLPAGCWAMFPSTPVFPRDFPISSRASRAARPAGR